MSDRLDETIGQPTLTLLLSESAKNSQLDVRSDMEFRLLCGLVGGYSSDPVLARRGIRELLMRAPGKFYKAALQILRTTESFAGQDYLTGLILEDDQLLLALSDPEVFPMDTAVALAKNLLRMDPNLDSKLIQALLLDDGRSSQGNGIKLEWILAIIDAVSDCSRLVPMLMKLLRHQDARVRSKSALLLVRAHRSPDWLLQQLQDEDPRVRANAIEGLLDTVPGEKELQLLWGAASDPSHRVASTALLVLLKNGRTEASEGLLKMAQHPNEMCRCAAAWAMMKTEELSYLETLQKMARSDTGNARRMALRASVHLRKLQGTNRIEAAPVKYKETGVQPEATGTI